MPYVTAKEYAELKRKANLYDKRQKEIQESFRIKAVCDTCGYQSINESYGWCPTVDCEGALIPVDENRS